MFIDRKGILLSHFVPDKLYYMIYKNHNHKTLIYMFLSSLNIFGKKKCLSLFIDIGKAVEQQVSTYRLIYQHHFLPIYLN